MNTDFLLFSLREAQEEIEKTIRDLETDSDYGEPEFFVAKTLPAGSDCELAHFGK